MGIRDILIATIGAVDLLAGGYWMLWPDTVSNVLGIFFIVSGAAIIILMWAPIVARGVLRSQFFLSRDWPNKLMVFRDWYLFKPQIDGDRYLNERRTSYKVENGLVTDCKIAFVFSVTNIYPIGTISISYSNAYLILIQKRAGNSYPFRFNASFPDGERKIKQLGDAEIFTVNFLSDKIGKPKNQAPNLEEQGTWRIYGVRVRFNGPLSFEKVAPPLKGLLFGRA